AVTVREAALVPRVLQQAFHLMRSVRTCQDQTRFPQPERRTVNPPVPDPDDQNASGEMPVAAREAPAPLHELYPQEIVSLIGPNGAGKTT
ncbi:hypothetical protein ACUOFC_58900, partial [Escherichia sp. TWPC-MK]